jgi:hypothetical protein
MRWKRAKIKLWRKVGTFSRQGNAEKERGIANQALKWPK